MPNKSKTPSTTYRFVAQITRYFEKEFAGESYDDAYEQAQNSFESVTHYDNWDETDTLEEIVESLSEKIKTVVEAGKHTNYIFYHKTPKLDEIQSLLGGYFEAHLSDDGKCDILVRDDTRGTDLEINVPASELWLGARYTQYQQASSSGYHLRGNAIFLYSSARLK